MASMQEEMDDSRTSAVGRKRNLGEIQDQDQVISRHSSLEPDAQRASKRVKEYDESLEDSVVEGGIIINTGSPSPVASLLPTETSPTLPTIAAAPRTGTWNRGVQSGLRTSFGSRLKAQPKSMIPSSRDEDVDIPSRTIPDATSLPQMHTSTTSEQGEGEDIHVAETTDLQEMQTAIPPEAGSEVSGAQKLSPQMDIPISSEEEEGEISSLRGAGGDVDMLYEQTPGQYASGESSFSNGAVDNAESLQPQVSHPAGRDEGQPAIDDFGVDLQPRENFERPSSASDAEDMEDDGTPIEQDANPPFTMLSEAEVAQLTDIEKRVYLKARHEWIKQEQRRKALLERVESFNRLTSKVEAIFAHEVLPLPSKYSAMEENIFAGLTFFPRKVARNGPFYRKNNVNYTASEVLNDRRPIRIQDLTFDMFAPSFLKDNSDKLTLINPQMLVAAFNSYRVKFYSPHAIALGYPNASAKSPHATDAAIAKEERKQAKVILENFQLMDSAPPPVLPDKHEHDSVPNNEPVEIDIDQEDIESMERELQQKYFPSASDRPATYRCLACGDICHKTVDCPSLTCALCDGNHAQFTCPQNQRCNKCRNRGHKAVDCPEKLALSKEEAIGCDFCGSTDHLEKACHFIWRTFHPKATEIRRVREIPVHCYICGGTGHYGPECGLYKAGQILSGGETWSKSNLLKYIDVSSTDRAMSAGIDYSIESRSMKEFGIKGKANNPIDPDDGDDEDVIFISERVKKPKQRGQIKIVGTARLGQPQQEAFHRAPNPPRQSRPDFLHHAGGKIPPKVESARYGQERTLSPPRFDDMRNNFPEEDDHFRPQAPQRENNYRPPPPQAQNGYQPIPQGSLPVRPPLMASSNVPRGGHSGRGGRGGGNNARGGGGKRGKKGKGANRGGGAAGRGK